jgi:hypothetical protein
MRANNSSTPGVPLAEAAVIGVQAHLPLLILHLAVVCNARCFDNKDPNSPRG